MTVTPEQATDAANEAFGSHRGYRALHAKGTLLKGAFTATAQAATLTKAGHLHGDPIPVTARVSNGAGDPGMPDYAPDVRGLAVKLYLADGTRTDIVAQTSARFPFATPDRFVELLRAQHRSPAMAVRLPLAVIRNPRAVLALPATVQSLRPPVSYATCRYYGIHAFRFLDADGGSRYVRYTFVPEAGDVRLGVREAKGRGRNYLQDEIRERLSRAPVRFRLELQIAGAGDNVNDPSSTWTSERERVDAGVLELTELETERETGGDVLVFDPTRVVDGIELSDDPVLRFRHDAYSESVSRRRD
jgi:catalase